MPRRARFEFLVIPTALFMMGATCVKPHNPGESSPDSPLTLEERVAHLEEKGGGESATGTATAQRANMMADEIREYRKRTEAAIEALQEDTRSLNNRLDDMQRMLDDARRGGALTNPDAAGTGAPIQLESQMKEIIERVNDLTGKYNSMILVLRQKDILTADPKAALSPTGAAPDAPPTTPPANQPNEEALYKEAYDLYKVGKFEEAREKFNTMLTAYPKGGNADNGRYWMGECYFSLKKYDRAIAEFSKLVSDFPQSNKNCRAILKMGYAFLELKMKNEANTAFDKVIASCKNTEEARLATKKKAKM